MRTFLHHSIESRRYHVAILTILVGLIAWVLLSYFRMIQAKVEEYTFEKNIITMQRFFDTKAMLTDTNDKKCNFLDSRELFSARMGIFPVLEASEIFQSNRISRWQYEVNKRRLIYKVNSSKYFSSPLGNKIYIDLICKDGFVKLDISPHKWCQEFHWFSC